MRQTICGSKAFPGNLRVTSQTCQSGSVGRQFEEIRRRADGLWKAPNQGDRERVHERLDGPRMAGTTSHNS